MSHNFHDVFVFHEKFGLLAHDTPGPLSQRKLRERVEFLEEELDEFVKGCFKRDLAEQADALIDLVYVAMGTAVMLGLPWEELWDDVHRANMSKVRGVTHRGHAVDVTKPAGWVGPQTHQILRDSGFNPVAGERDDPQ